MLNTGADLRILYTIYKYGKEILHSESFHSEKKYMQHGSISCYMHSMAVTYISVRIAQRFNMNVDMASLVRGALLHDYFLYDWHVKSPNRPLHGYFHAKRALKNAIRDFHINSTEQKIIYSHMFPLNISRIPQCREAAIVCLADKICATLETVHRKGNYPLLVQFDQKLPLISKSDSFLN